MAKVEFKLEGYEQFKAQLQQLARSDIQAAAYSGAAGGAKQVRDNAKQNVINQGLVDTGALLRGIVFKKEKEYNLSGIISYIVAVRHGRRRTKRQRKINDDPFYWMFWEFGTRRNEARPFMVPALAGHVREVSNTVQGKMYGRLKRNKLIK